MPFHQETIKTWKGLLDYWKEHLAAEEWLFRGTSCSEWKLKTSLERTCQTHYEQPLSSAAYIEYIIYREFRRRYHNYRVGIPDPDGIEWLSLMQHYGAPTRLLDFTYSFFIAAYFAVEKPSEKSRPHAIWAIRNKWVAREGLELLKRSGKDVRYLENEQNERQWELQKPFFESLLNLQGPENINPPCVFQNPSCVFPVNAMRLNERSTIQQGVFLCPGNVTKPFEENLRRAERLDKKENLVKLKLEFSNQERLEALRRLHAMGINRTALFPGLEGFAQSLGIYHPLLFA